MSKSKKKKVVDGKLLIGRYEWCALPDLNIPIIKGKVDTGAKTSAIHAFNIKHQIINKKPHALFDIHPLQSNTDICINCRAPIIDERDIMSSNGHIEKRYIIETLFELGDHAWMIELSLSNRDPLKFRLLLGRQALRKRVLIDPDHASYQRCITNNDTIFDIYK